MAHKDKQVGVFLEELAASSATPGGGAAAALAGAMGAGLVGMACRLTIGRGRFADVADELSAVLEEAETLRIRLTELADADSEAFDQVMAAFRLPKETEAEGAARGAAVQSALRTATRVPLETARACATVIALAAPAIEKINPNALGDAGVAALLADAGLKSAQLNVAINLADIHDPKFTRETEGDLRGILAGAGEAKERVFAYVLDQV
jgi:formiminotetrahydrofolate cyclodeaminase